MKKLITIQTDNGEVTYELASFGSRLGARIIDVLIIVIPSCIIPILFPWLYYALQHSGGSQATVGQRSAGIMVVDMYGRKVGFGQATGRFFGNILNVLTIFIGYFMFFFTENNQCLHDLVSNCLVVNNQEVSRTDSLTDNLLDFENL